MFNILTMAIQSLMLLSSSHIVEPEIKNEKYEYSQVICASYEYFWCMNCGYRNDAGSKSCVNCGASK